MSNYLDFSLNENKHIYVPVNLNYEETKKYLNRFLISDICNDSNVIRVSETLVESWQKTTGTFDCCAEYSLLHIEASIFLMKYDCCIFHAVAVLINGKAWLLAGRSGVGKSTQYINMLQIAPDRIKIINGDKPLMEIKNGNIYIHPSPWNGKEGWYSDISGSLGGIIFLKQGKSNTIKKLDIPHSIIPVYRSICQDYRNDEVLEDTARIAEKLIMSVPVWEFINDGTLISSQILLHHLFNQG